MSDENIQRTLGSMEAKIDSLTNLLHDMADRMDKRINHHDGRLRDMELKQSWVAGMATAVGAAASFATSWIKDHIR